MDIYLGRIVHMVKLDFMARSVADEINPLRTTMTVESHWCVIKHDYLHHFNHPRLDLLIHILIQKVIS